MSNADLIARLKQFKDHTIGEAAAEIERLNAVVAERPLTPEQRVVIEAAKRLYANLPIALRDALDALRVAEMPKAQWREDPHETARIVGPNDTSLRVFTRETFDASKVPMVVAALNAQEAVNAPSK